MQVAMFLVIIFVSVEVVGVDTEVDVVTLLVVVLLPVAS
jgi:hypothetical protein